MAHEISEADWRIFRELHSIALERFCQRVLSEVQGVISGNDTNAHERYKAIYRLIQKRDREMAEAFDNPRRSAALLQLVSIQSHDLLTQDELVRFSVDIREAIQSLKGF